MISRATSASLLLLALTGTPVRAQMTHSLAATVGVSEYDLSGTGTSLIYAVRLETRVVPFLVVEPGIARFDYGSSITHWFPELTVQLQVPGRVQPFLGGGIGASFASTPFGSYRDLTLLALAGLRVRMVGRWSLRAELRVREVHPWAGTMADWAGGLSYRL